MEGWIKIHRSMLEWEWYSDTNTTRLFLHLLLTANREDKKWQGINVKKGQLITSVGNLSKITRLSPRSVRTCLIKLKTTGELTSKTTSRCTMLTICNYEYYQGLGINSDKQSDKQSDKRATNERQTSDKRATTTKEKKRKERKKEKKEVKNITLAFPSFVSSNFSPVWEKWLVYRKELHKPYRTETGMKTKYNELIKLSGDDPKKAMLIVEQSIGNEWTGFFMLKTNGKVVLSPGEDIIEKGIREVREARAVRLKYEAAEKEKTKINDMLTDMELENMLENGNKE